MKAIRIVTIGLFSLIALPFSLQAQSLLDKPQEVEKKMKEMEKGHMDKLKEAEKEGTEGKEGETGEKGESAKGEKVKKPDAGGY